MEDNLTVWLRNLLTPLCTVPSEIEIDRKVDEQGVLFTIKVAKDDIGKVIGKQGTIATAIRTLLRSAGFNQDMRASLKIDAPESHFKAPREEY